MSWLNLRKQKKEPESPRQLAVHPRATMSRRVDVGVKQNATLPSTSSGREAADAKEHIDVLRRPHISERAGDQSAKGVYVFRVSASATKRQIRAAVAALYGVTVKKVRTVTVHPKKIVVKGKLGMRSGGKKAYVYLKKGEKIEVL